MTSTLQIRNASGELRTGTLPDRHAELDGAKLLQFVWKTEAMMGMLLAVVHLALDRDEFSASDLPAEMVHGGNGIAGSVFAELMRQEIIERVGLLQGKDFLQKVVKTNREGRKAAKVGVYRLRDQAKAEAFLRAKHGTKELKQGELMGSDE